MSKVFELSQPVEFVGEWWLPGHDEDRVVGRLNYDSEGFSLELEGYFQHRIEEGFSDTELKIIHGFASGYKITLLDCFLTTHIVPPLEKAALYAPKNIIANYAIIGLYIFSEEELLIDRVYFQTTDIKHWSYLTGFHSSEEIFETTSEGKKGFNLRYTLPENENIFSNQEIDIILIPGINFPVPINPLSSVVITEKNYFLLKNKQNQTGLFFFDYIDAVRKFLTFVCRSEIEVEHVRIVTDDGSDAYILYTPILLDLDYKNPESTSDKVFFTLPSVKKRIGDIFESWLENFNNMPEVYNLYFYKSKGMLNDVFITKAQALEEYHRSTKENSERWTFKNRIENLYGRFYEAMKFRGEKEVISKLILDHRDYYTHWFKKKKGKVFHGFYLDILARDTNLLLEMCLLSTMNFNDEEVTNIVKNYFPYRSYLGVNRPMENGYPKDTISWTSDKLPT